MRGDLPILKALRSTPIQRPRRLRGTEVVRELVRETELSPGRLVMPLFLVEGERRREPIAAMPGCDRVSIDEAIADVHACAGLGVRAAALFPKVDDARKTNDGDEALRDDSLACRALRAIKREYPEVCLVADIALDPYSSYGHDGVVRDGQVANDETVEILAQMAVLHAQCGADIVAPSDMMDGRVGAIRSSLDRAGREATIILSYAVKYASAFYGPFRQALDSAPVAAAGVPADKSTYQMDPANVREALREVQLDEEEGADILMVKPGMPCLDVIAAVRDVTTLPIAAYQVSGEYAMIKAAAMNGWLEETRCMVESLVAIRRAGADLIFSYFARNYAKWWRERFA